MPLDSGTRLGPYEIAALIGAGGMGEVYRARDTRLGRDVAIKVLPAALARDPQGLARFEREARAVAAISHPNIVALFDIGRQPIEGASDEVTFVVNELLEGKTVRQRLEEGPIPARKALDMARQIADALAATHDRGIVHRDLKPENVFVTTDGRVKVLDFGLAQVAATAGLESTETMAAAPKTIGTTPGTILGTIGYMAPEQVRGQPVDARADLFALGAMLYEMLTAERAFSGQSAADTISAILHTEPAQLSRIAAIAPPSIERIVRRCLEKAPAERFQSARDLSFALDTMMTSGANDVAMTGVSAAPRARLRATPIVAGATVLVVVVALVAYAAGRRGQALPPPAPVALFSIPANIAPFDAASVSPDGRYVAYTGAPTFQNALGGISLRRLDSLQVQPLVETTAAIPPIFWSPDSRSVGYFVNSVVVVRELPDGPPRRVVDIQGRSTGAAWGPNGMLVIGTTAGLFKVPATGGALQPVLKTDPAHEIWRGLPSFLPGGDRLLYTLLRAGEGEASLETHAATIDGRELGLVLRGVVGAAYADGHLLYGSNGALYARPFDPARLTFTGNARQIAPSVLQNWRTGDVAARASETGVLVFRGAPESDVQFTWMDRTGRRLGTVGAVDAFNNFDVSPDGLRIMTSRRDPKTGGSSLWLIDTERGVTSLVTSKDDDGFDDPTWTPDGRFVAYRHNDRIALRAANGGEERTLLPKEAYPDAFTRDGRFLVFGLPRESLFEAWVLDVLTPGAKPFPVVGGVTLADEGRFSPSGKWLAYHSNESGSDQVALIPFPPTGEKWQISKAGGVQPRWSADGQELFYLDPQGRLMAVRVPDSDPRRAAEPQPLFSTGLAPSNAIDQFAVVGSRFLFRLPASTTSATSSPVQVLTNWTRAGS
jgi:dipeptidyl aminopeptidase/acylaminoacyl peptidase